MTDEIVAYDVETTGLSPNKGHRIIEVGAVRIVNGSFAEEFHSLIDCGGRISPRQSVTFCHGLKLSAGNWLPIKKIGYH